MRIAMYGPIVRLLLQYGEGAGDFPFRSALATFLTRQYQGKDADVVPKWPRSSSSIGVHPNELFTTTGCSSALELCCSALTKPGDVVIVPEPTYFLALNVFKDHGLTIVSVPDDANSDVATGNTTLAKAQRLREAAMTHCARLMYFVPSFSNPTGGMFLWYVARHGSRWHY